MVCIHIWYIIQLYLYLSTCLTSDRPTHESIDLLNYLLSIPYLSLSIYLSTSYIPIYLCVELDTFMLRNGWSAWDIFPWHVTGLRRLLTPCFSSLPQAIKLPAGLHIDIHNSDALCPCRFTSQFKQETKVNTLEGYCIHTDNVGNCAVCSKEPRNSMTCQYCAGHHESSLPRATC